LSRKRSRFDFSSITLGLNISLKECVKSIWFGLNVPHNKSLIKESFKTYKEIYPWLRDTHKTTLLDNSVLFRDAVSLSQNIESLSTRDRSFKCFSPVKQSSLERMVINYMRYNSKRGHLLTEAKNMTFENEINENSQYDSSYYICSTIMSGPVSDDDKKEEIYGLKFENYNFLLDKNRVRQKLYILKMIIEEKPVNEILSNIIYLRESPISYYKVPQKYSKEKGWFGYLLIEIISQEGMAQIELSVDKSLIVRSTSQIVINLLKNKIFSILRENNLEKYMSHEGPRFSNSGFIQKSGVSGIKYKIDKDLIKSVDVQKFKLDIKFSNIGYVKIVNIQKDQRDSTICTFGFSKLSVPYNVASDSVISKWIRNEKFNYKDLITIKRLRFDWLKESFNLIMTNRYKPNRILGSLLEMDEINIEDFNIHEFMNFEVDYEEMNEAIDAFDDDPLDMDFNAIDFGEIEYVQKNRIVEYESQRYETKSFDLILENVSYLNVKEIYLSEYRVEFSDKNEWLDLFCELIDYQNKPVIPRYRTVTETDKVIESVDELKGKPYVIMVSGDIMKEKAKLVMEALSDDSYIIENDLAPRGLYYKTATENTFKKFERKFSLNLDKIASDIMNLNFQLMKEAESNPNEEEESVVFEYDSKTQQFKTNKLSFKYMKDRFKEFKRRYISRNEDQKEEPRSGEFEVSNPIYQGRTRVSHDWADHSSDD